MNRPRVMEHLGRRLLGLVLVGALMVVYQSQAGDVTNRLIVPMAMALGAWMMVQNLMAVALGAGALALAHSSPGSSDWVTSAAYPGLATVCAAAAGWVLTRRFRRRIEETHEERWRDRPSRRGASARAPDSDEPS